jgi:retron-type reverse transcriptase
MVLNQIYEEDFLGFSYGFRPGRSQHQAEASIKHWMRCGWGSCRRR